jgi:predicted phosphodiesterase
VEDYEAFNFIAYGDTRSSDLLDAVSPLQEEIVGSYLQHDPNLIIHTGDMVHSGGLWDQWDDFNESISAVREAGIPLYGVAGNHEKYTDQWDVHDENLTNYQAYFDFTDAIDQPGETELHYSLNYEGVHFVFLNTEDRFEDVEGGSSVFNCSTAQMDWLLADLNQTRADDFIVASFHRTAWSIRVARPGRWEEAATIRREFHDIFIQHGVDLIFMGHDHYYYRTIRDGIFYVTTGGGGAPLAGVDTEAPTWQMGDVAHKAYHYCNVEVDSTTVKVTTLTPEGVVLDNFTLNRRGAHAPSIDLTSPQNTTYTASDIPLNFSIDRPPAWTGYSLDGQGNLTITGDTTITGLTEGPHQIRVFANDTLGTMGASESVHFTVSFPEVLGDLSITVRDSDGSPLSGVEVRSTTTPSEQPSLNGTTASDGTILFQSLKTGDYAFEANKDGFISNNSSTNLPEGGSIEISMTLEAEPEPEQEPEPEPEPEPEERRGIPGFPLASTIMGLMTGIALIWLLRERCRLIGAPCTPGYPAPREVDR